MTDRAVNNDRCLRPIYVIRLRAAPGVDGIRALRAFLKVALRCSACFALRGWLSHTTLASISGVIRKFGTPESPIIIRRGGVR